MEISVLCWHMVVTIQRTHTYLHRFLQYLIRQILHAKKENKGANTLVGIMNLDLLIIQALLICLFMLLDGKNLISKLF